MEISIAEINSNENKSLEDHYKIIQKIGSGGFGIVYKAKQLSTGETVAIKKISINNSTEKYQRTIKEIDLLKNLSHPNIVKYYDFFDDGEFIYLITEFLEGGTLKQYMIQNQNISENETRIIITQLLNALSYLHYTCDICHRDIKPENIMFKEKNNINTVKLLDFGLSTDSFESRNFLDNCGTLIYMAPEQINNITYSKAVDVWSVGIIFYMLLNKGKNPFFTKNDTKEKTIKKITSSQLIFDDNCKISTMAKYLIKKLLKKNPNYRYTVRVALSHPWITMNKFDKIPMTIYDKAFIDEYSEKLNIIAMTTIFLNYYKNKNLKIKQNRKSKEKLFKLEKNSKIICKNLTYFNMDDYEKKIIDTNLILQKKYKENREYMFNPILNSCINKNKVAINYNELLSSSFVNKIKCTHQKKENQIYNNNAYSSNIREPKRYSNVNSLTEYNEPIKIFDEKNKIPETTRKKVFLTKNKNNNENNVNLFNKDIIHKNCNKTLLRNKLLFRNRDYNKTLYNNIKLNQKDEQKIERRKIFKEASCFLSGNNKKRRFIKNKSSKNNNDFDIEKQFSKFRNLKCFNFNNANNFPFLKEPIINTKKGRIYSSSKNERNTSSKNVWKQLPKLFVNNINKNFKV